MNPQTMLKVKITAGTIWDDLLDLLSLPLVKAVVWMLSILAAFAAGRTL